MRDSATPRERLELVAVPPGRPALLLEIPWRVDPSGMTPRFWRERGAIYGIGGVTSTRFPRGVTRFHSTRVAPDGPEVFVDEPNARGLETAAIRIDPTRIGARSLLVSHRGETLVLPEPAQWPEPDIASLVSPRPAPASRRPSLRLRLARISPSERLLPSGALVSLPLGAHDRDALERWLPDETRETEPRGSAPRILAGSTPAFAWVFDPDGLELDAVSALNAARHASDGRDLEAARLLPLRNVSGTIEPILCPIDRRPEPAFEAHDLRNCLGLEEGEGAVWWDDGSGHERCIRFLRSTLRPFTRRGLERLGS